MSRSVSSLGFSRALVLAPREDVAKVDRNALREAGIRQVRILSSGVEAARMLAGPTTGTPEERIAAAALRPDADLVLCHDQLADTSPHPPVRLIRLHPRLLPFPALVAVATGDIATRTRAVESGYSGLLVRPYAQTALAEQLERAAQCRDATSAAMPPSASWNADAFWAALERHATVVRSLSSDQQYREALLTLRQHQWSESVTLLQRFIRENPTHGDAFIALSAAFRGMGNTERSRAILRESLAVFADNGAWDKARAVCERLCREYGGCAVNPLLEEAARLVMKGQSADAVQAVLAGNALKDENALCDALFKGCAASGDPEQALRLLSKAFAEAGHADMGGHLARRLEMTLAVAAGEADPDEDPDEAPAFSPERRASGQSPQSLPPLPAVRHGSAAPRKLREPAPSGGLFPSLSEAWTVVKVTAGLFRQLK